MKGVADRHRERLKEYSEQSMVQKAFVFMLRSRPEFY
jgi:hypothetical protein